MNCETNDCRKEKRGCKGCFYDEGTEITADKMFEELGYTKNELKNKWGKVWGIDYQNPRKWISIKIDFIDAEICTSTLDEDGEPVYITMQELQAINKKVEELGWKKMK